MVEEMVYVQAPKPGLKVKRGHPTFEYVFGAEPLGVPAEHAKIILRNSDFKKVDGQKKAKLKKSKIVGDEQ